MSIKVAIAWARRTIRQPRAVDDVVELLQRASREDKRATLLLSEQLTRNRKGWLVRWTGHEFVAAELSRVGQAGLGMTAGSMCRELDVFPDGKRPHKQCLTLSQVVIDNEGRLKSDQPIVGRCVVHIDDASLLGRRICALRGEYYRPDLKRSITGYWPIDEALRPGGHELPFTLPGPECDKNSGKIVGTLALFLQMVTVDRWLPAVTGLCEISNTATALVELKP